MGLQLLVAAHAIKAGYSLSEVSTLLKSAQHTLRVFISLETVDYLVKGGRLNALTGNIVDTLHIKPILSFNPEGKLYLLPLNGMRSISRNTSARKPLPLSYQLLPPFMPMADPEPQESLL